MRIHQLLEYCALPEATKGRIADERRARLHYADVWRNENGEWEWLGDERDPFTAANEMKWLIPCLPWTLIKISENVEHGTTTYRRVFD